MDLKDGNLSHARPVHLGLAVGRKRVSFRLRMCRVEAVLGIFQRIALPLHLPPLEPEIERLLEPKAWSGEEEPC